MISFSFLTKFLKCMNEQQKLLIDITRVNFERNPRNPNWGQRPLSYIKKIVVHQELGNGNIYDVHKYHTSVDSHLKLGVGAPAFAYHYGIEKNGSIIQVNDLTDITWHTKGQNLHGIGIMLVGNFSYEEHPADSPTKEQLNSLRQLLDFLVKEHGLTKQDVYGHIDFGKKSCPGFEVYDLIVNYKRKTNK